MLHVFALFGFVGSIALPTMEASGQRSDSAVSGPKETAESWWKRHQATGHQLEVPLSEMQTLAYPASAFPAGGDASRAQPQAAATSRNRSGPVARDANNAEPPTLPLPSSQLLDNNNLVARMVQAGIVEYSQVQPASPPSAVQAEATAPPGSPVPPSSLLKELIRAGTHLGATMAMMGAHEAHLEEEVAISGGHLPVLGAHEAQHLLSNISGNVIHMDPVPHHWDSTRCGDMKKRTGRFFAFGDSYCIDMEFTGISIRSAGLRRPAPADRDRTRSPPPAWARRTDSAETIDDDGDADNLLSEKSSEK